MLKLENLKAGILALVKHSFWVIKCKFVFVKARYNGHGKNVNKPATLFALANIVRMGQLISAQD
ncbi:MAG: hypothetical protein QS721_06510 [Candidatus Endonucleobacter sp. (ex Gigantidas childressi)]|nr:hypothetical protein [Candidatus Endonucleobacter sp. (ex Gigantidas childressi)]